MRPSSVHSVKATSQSTTGFTQWTALPFARGNTCCFRARQDRLLRRDLIEAFRQIARALHGEAGADFARIAQRAVFAITQIQRAQARGRRSRAPLKPR